MVKQGEAFTRLLWAMTQAPSSLTDIYLSNTDQGLSDSSFSGRKIAFVADRPM